MRASTVLVHGARWREVLQSVLQRGRSSGNRNRLRLWTSSLRKIASKERMDFLIACFVRTEVFGTDLRRLPETSYCGSRLACQLRRRSRSRKEVVHVNDSACAPDPSADWRTPHVALQQELGVLPERGLGSDRAHSSRTRIDWKSVRSSSTDFTGTTNVVPFACTAVSLSHFFVNVTKSSSHLHLRGSYIVQNRSL